MVPPRGLGPVLPASCWPPTRTPASCPNRSPTPPGPPPASSSPTPPQTLRGMPKAVHLQLEAEAEFQAVVDAESRLLGHDNSETLLSRPSLASVRHAPGPHDRAHAEFVAVLA